MLLWILDHLWQHTTSSGLSLEKITLRAALAAMASFVLAVAMGPHGIAWLRAHFREPIKCDSDQVRRLHAAKESTPTMGGLFIVAGLVAGLLVFSDLGNANVQVALLLAVGLGMLGAVDDLVKLHRVRNGISVRWKLAGQVLICTVAALWLERHLSGLPGGLFLHLPLLPPVELGVWFVPWATLVLVGSCNAVNLTDGLDGLAGGCLIFSVAAMTVVAYAAGHAAWADHLGIARVAGAGEVTVLAGALIGALLGFLWFNCHPAQVFMGDTGSLPLGGLLGLLALASRQEWLLVPVGAVFVVEALSVIVQVGFFKWRGRRVLLCAPLHHHFQLKGWPETRIVVRFWIASALCALLGMAMLKLNLQEFRHPADAPTIAAKSTARR